MLIFISSSISSPPTCDFRTFPSKPSPSESSSSSVSVTFSSSLLYTSVTSLCNMDKGDINQGLWHEYLVISFIHVIIPLGLGKGSDKNDTFKQEKEKKKKKKLDFASFFFFLPFCHFVLYSVVCPKTKLKKLLNSFIYKVIYGCVLNETSFVR